ncbi:MAG: hypothetical protein ACI9FJ_001725 [Alteromonadaceae bacterium]
MQNPNELLAASVAAFEQWRTKRTFATQTIPPALQQQTVALLDNFSSSKIVIALNISGTNRSVGLFKTLGRTIVTGELSNGSN